MDIESYYNDLLEGGELMITYPGLTGKWKKDKEDFTRLFTLNSQDMWEDSLLDDLEGSYIDSEDY